MRKSYEFFKSGDDLRSIKGSAWKKCESIWPLPWLQQRKQLGPPKRTGKQKFLLLRTRVSLPKVRLLNKFVH